MFHDQSLDWPAEATQLIDPQETWYSSPGNLCLDFHGDPANADLVVFSDGNHHMALADALQGFRQANPDIRDIFYMTTPPSVVITMLEKGGIYLGNLYISAQPNILIGPGNIIDAIGKKHTYVAEANYMQSRGCALIVAHGNPKGISGIEDLNRSDIRIACSNPETETASYKVYRETALQLLGNTPNDTFLTLQDSRMVFSRRIHHREIPRLISTHQADVALVYYHLALRYARIFPQQINYVPLADENLDIFPGHSITQYKIAQMDTSEHTARLHAFLCGPDVRQIYKRHGLLEYSA